MIRSYSSRGLASTYKVARLITFSLQCSPATQMSLPITNGEFCPLIILEIIKLIRRIWRLSVKINQNTPNPNIEKCPEYYLKSINMFHWKLVRCLLLFISFFFFSFPIFPIFTIFFIGSTFFKFLCLIFLFLNNFTCKMSIDRHIKGGPSILFYLSELNEFLKHNNNGRHPPTQNNNILPLNQRPPSKAIEVFFKSATQRVDELG